MQVLLIGFAFNAFLEGAARLVYQLQFVHFY
ncbi:hypothetical protein ACVNP1_04515 [Staphylococcus aureus]